MFTKNFFFNNVSGTVAAPFSPADISNLVGWWDAGNGVTFSGSAVTAWADQSVTTGTFTKQSGSNYIYYPSGFGVNSRPYIKTQNVSYYQTSSDWPSTSASTVFVVGRVAFAGGIYLRYMSTTTDYPNAFVWLTTGNSPYSFNSSFSSNLGGPNLSSIVDAPIVVRTRWNGTNSFMKVNDLAEYSSTGVISSQGNVKLVLGYTNTGYSVGFDVAEIIIYNKVLDAGELTQVDNYLSTKYGITL